MTEPLVDIIIRDGSGSEMAADLLHDIYGDAADTPASQIASVIVVHDGCQASCAALPTALPLGAVNVHLHPKRGAVSATNAGLAQALLSPAEYVVIFDDDVRIPAGDKYWLDRWLEEMREFGDTGALGATSDRMNAPQHILTAPQTYMRDWQADDGHGTKSNPAVPQFVSAAVMLRKAAVRDCGMWDEQYNPGQFEDTDYSIALRRAGWKIRVARSVYIQHLCHRTVGDKLKTLLETNFRKFILKHGAGTLWDLGMMDGDQLMAFLQQRQKEAHQ